MICAVCSCFCSSATTYRLGNLAGKVCSECQSGLASAVRGWMLTRMRDTERERQRREKEARIAARALLWQAEYADRLRSKAERQAARAARAAQKTARSELFPAKRKRALKLVGGQP